jgi:transposase
LRLRAAVWFAEGVSQAEVARRAGVSPQAVSTWHRRWVDGGAQALRPVGPPGARRRVPDREFAEVATVLEAGPRRPISPGRSGRSRGSGG